MLYVIIMAFVILAKTPCIVVIVLMRESQDAEMEYAKVMKSLHALMTAHLGATITLRHHLTVGMESVTAVKKPHALMTVV